MFTLSVVVPATDEPPTLDRCLTAIRASASPPDELIVVTDPGLSASAARNRGAASATGEIVVFVDADVEVHADALRRVRDHFETDPDLAAVFGSYDDSPDHRSIVSAFRNLLHHHVHHGEAGPAETFWTGLGAIRREVFAAVGGFDEDRYPVPSIEDIELGDRLRQGAHAVVLDPGILGTHLKVWTLRSMLWTDLVHRGIPWVGLQVRTRRIASSLNCGWRHRASALLVALLPVAVLLAPPLVVAALAVSFVGLNLAFYGLLARQLGAIGAMAGVALHGLHHLVAVVAVPLGVMSALVAHWSSRRSELDAEPVAVVK